MKLAINTDFGFDNFTDEEKIEHIAKAHFDGMFIPWSRNINVESLINAAKKNKLLFQSVHAPFYEIDKMWADGNLGDCVLNELIDCLRDCKKLKAPIMICHAYIGAPKEIPNKIGYNRYKILLDEAEKENIMVAFENTESEEYLKFIKENFWNHPNAGFCVDTGHELCFNSGKDMISEYGQNGKLIATHLNDNMGITGNEITWLDDSHMLPFDGMVDFEYVANRMKKMNYKSEWLTYEVMNENHPERNTHDIYKNLDIDEFLENCYENAVKFKKIYQNTFIK